jgi:tRNA wybutosine-synthesizing protein 3
MGGKEYLDAKERALIKLVAASADHKVDEKILPILGILNGMEGVYTSSSCAGRIVLLQIPRLGDKRGAVFLGVWHRLIVSEEIILAATKATQGSLWLLAQSPILHIGVQTTDLANKLIKTAVLSGFKNSVLKSIGKKIMVEFSSTERLDAPIGRNGCLYCEGDYLHLLTEIANEVIERSQQKLIRLERNLRNIANGL